MQHCYALYGDDTVAQEALATLMKGNRVTETHYLTDKSRAVPRGFVAIVHVPKLDWRARALSMQNAVDRNFLDKHPALQSAEIVIGVRPSSRGPGRFQKAARKIPTFVARCRRYRAGTVTS